MATENEIRQEILDEEHLRLLSLFYYVRAGTTAFFACIPILHVIAGIAIIILSRHTALKPNEPSPAFIGWTFLGIGLTIIVFGWAFAVLEYLVGRFIRQRRHRAFCLIMAGLNCLAIPYGTFVGAMTFIVLGRDSVRARFAASDAAADAQETTPCSC
jgi:hypothetical protein